MKQVPEISIISEKEIDTIITLANSIWPATYKTILTAEQITYMLELFYSTDSLKDQLKNQHHRFIVAKCNDEAVGFASYSQTKPGIHKLHKLYVEQALQGQGIGKFMIGYIISELKTTGAEALVLNVNRQNPAIRFYEKAGFQIVSEEDIDIGNGYFMNDYVMQKALDSK